MDLRSICGPPSKTASHHFSWNFSKLISTCLPGTKLHKLSSHLIFSFYVPHNTSFDGSSLSVGGSFVRETWTLVDLMSTVMSLDFRTKGGRGIFKSTSDI